MARNRSRKGFVCTVHLFWERPHLVFPPSVPCIVLRFEQMRWTAPVKTILGSVQVNGIQDRGNDTNHESMHTLPVPDAMAEILRVCVLCGTEVSRQQFLARQALENLLQPSLREDPGVCLHFCHAVL